VRQGEDELEFIQGIENCRVAGEGVQDAQQAACGTSMVQYKDQLEGSATKLLVEEGSRQLKEKNRHDLELVD
jgi:hypothetical protein